MRACSHVCVCMFVRMYLCLGVYVYSCACAFSCRSYFRVEAIFQSMFCVRIRVCVSAFICIRSRGNSFMRLCACSSMCASMFARVRNSMQMHIQGAAKVTPIFID